MKAIFILSLMCLLGACSVDVGGNKVIDTGGGKSSDHSYELIENGCNTGKHSFSSQEAYCDGLKNDAANKYCAHNLRYSTFRQNCPGRSWQ